MARKLPFEDEVWNAVVARANGAIEHGFCLPVITPRSLAYIAPREAKDDVARAARDYIAKYVATGRLVHREGHDNGYIISDRILVRLLKRNRAKIRERALDKLSRVERWALGHGKLEDFGP